MIEINVEDREFRWYVQALIKNNPKFKTNLMRALTMRCRKRISDLLKMGHQGFWDASSHNTPSLMPHLHWGKKNNLWEVYFDRQLAGKTKGRKYTFEDLAGWVEKGTKPHTIIQHSYRVIENHKSRPKLFFSQGVATFENFDLKKITMDKVKKFYDKGAEA